MAHLHVCQPYVAVRISHPCCKKYPLVHTRLEQLSEHVTSNLMVFFGIPSRPVFVTYSAAYLQQLVHGHCLIVPLAWMIFNP